MSDNEDEKRADEERDESDAEASSEGSSEGSSESDSEGGAEPGSERGSEDTSAASASGSAAAADKGQRLSAGARLAAQKAAKAVVKAAKKEERRAAQAPAQEAPDEPAAVEAADEDPLAQLQESELGRAALNAGAWWETNAQAGWIALAVAALAIVGFLGFTYHRDSQSSAAGALLEDAVEIASARIEAPSDDAEDGAAADDSEADADEADDERTFPTAQARDEAALEAYQQVITQFPDHPSAGIARLGAARALLALGRNDEAREAFQAAFDRNGQSGVIAWQALEGVGFVQEAAHDLDGAQETYERLGNLENHAYQSVASYHLARLQLQRGERDAARTALRELVDSLRADTTEEESSEPRFPYVLAQAEVRLRELDPSSATSATPSLLGPGGPGGEGGGEGGEIDPEQLQELIRQLQARQAGAGGEGGGGE